MAKLRQNWLSYLTLEEIKQIDAASRRVLAEAGVRIEDEELVARLLDKGCTRENGRVMFPSDVVDAALTGVKNELILAGRNGEKLHLRDGYVATHTGGSIPFVSDPVTGVKRDATLTDLIDMLKVMNQLENLSMPGGLVAPMEVPSPISEVKQMEATMRYCQKPVSGTAVSSAAQARYVLELYQVLADATPDRDGHHMMSLGISPESPLYYPKEILDIMKQFISLGIPTTPLVAPILGFTAPMTIAGGLTQMNASYLAYTVISREINPDTVIIYGARLAVANMRTAHSVWGVPEVGIMGACSAQLARYYGLLSDVYGYSSMSCTLDSQWGYECCLNGLLPFLTGANILSGFGSYGSGFITSYESLVLDNEVFGTTLRAAQGVVVDEDHLAVEGIKEAMNGKDYFLQQHTLKHLRTGELYQPKVGLYGLIKQWEDDGSPDVREKARARVRELLDSHVDMPLPDEAEREFGRIMKAAEKELL